MPFKIQPGTDKGLCGTCRESTIVEFGNGEFIIDCDVINNTVKISRPVVKCSAYHNKNAPSKQDMYNIAWTIRTDKSGKIHGFVPPKKKGMYE